MMIGLSLIPVAVDWFAGGQRVVMRIMRRQKI